MSGYMGRMNLITELVYHKTLITPSCCVRGGALLGRPSMPVSTTELCEMGFSAADVDAALARASGDGDAALEALLSSTSKKRGREDEGSSSAAPLASRQRTSPPLAVASGTRHRVWRRNDAVPAVARAAAPAARGAAQYGGAFDRGESIAGPGRTTGGRRAARPYADGAAARRAMRWQAARWASR